MAAIRSAIESDGSVSEVVAAIDAAEERVRSVVPNAGLIYLEPDMLRADRAPAP